MNQREEDISFRLGAQSISGALTFPDGAAPFPAVVLLHGSDRSSRSDAYYKEHVHQIIKSGCAVLTYDGPGWGGQDSTGVTFETLEARAQEALAAIRYLRARKDIDKRKVGLWGISQGGWICQMAAAKSRDIAFIIPISGPGVTPAKQEVYRVWAESTAAGFCDTDVMKAVLIRQLLVDVVMDVPVFKAESLTAVAHLGDGPWSGVVDTIYAQERSTDLYAMIWLLNEIKAEPWTKYLHLDMVLSLFDSIPQEAWEQLKQQIKAMMIIDPADFLTRITCPVLAIFGSADTSIPVDVSVVLYRQYLTQAMNPDITIRIFPDASHTIQVNDAFAPGYFETINTWLQDRIG